MKSREIRLYFTNGTVTTGDINASEANDVFDTICEQMQRDGTGTVILNNDKQKTLINLENVNRVELEK